MVIWTQAAKADLRSIYGFIANDSKFYAKKVAQEIIEKNRYFRVTSLYWPCCSRNRR